MSSADFSNFGGTALGLAGTAYIVGETTKMLRNSERQARTMRTRAPSKKHKTHVTRKTNHVSKSDGWGFDFKL